MVDLGETGTFLTWIFQASDYSLMDPRNPPPQQAIAT